MSWNLDISVDQNFCTQVQEEWLRRAVDAVFELEDVNQQVELSLVITDDANVMELNRIYRGIDWPTDVLAFALQEDDQFPSVSGCSIQLGEVIISFDQARRQADEQGHSIQRELEILAIHGVLHLLGYDHQEDRQEEVMRVKENAALDRIGYVQKGQ